MRFFWGPIPWMIEIAAALSLLAKDYNDFAIILFLLLMNAAIGFFEERKADNALEALKAGLALTARARRQGQWGTVEAAKLVPGDIIRVRLGDVVPADCKLIEGDYMTVDQAALTGESLPVNKGRGQELYSGSIVKQGEMVAVVSATGERSFFGRTAKLVEGAGASSHFQQAVMRVGDFLIVLSLLLCALLSVVVLHRDFALAHSLDLERVLSLAKFILILTIASIPMAMPAVLSVTMALGALVLSKHKAIVSRLQAIEETAGVDVLCSDKTGTLTQNKLTLDAPVLFGAKTAEDCVLAAALASSADSQDSIDDAFLAGLADKTPLAAYERLRFVPFDPVSKRIETTAMNNLGQRLWGVPLDAAHIQTMMFLQLVVGGHLMLFVTRTKGGLWQRPWPALPLVSALVGTQLLAALLCGIGSDFLGIPALPWPLVGLVWAYNLVWMLLQDVGKRITYGLAKRHRRWTRRLSRPVTGA